MFIESGYIDNSSIIFEEYENTNNDIITDLCAFDLIIQQSISLLNKLNNKTKASQTD